jgi:hypothetical protein
METGFWNVRTLYQAGKKRLEKWERPGKKLELWPKTGSAGDASYKPYAP